MLAAHPDLGTLSVSASITKYSVVSNKKENEAQKTCRVRTSSEEELSSIVNNILASLMLNGRPSLHK